MTNINNDPDYETADDFTKWAMDTFSMSYDAVCWADMQRVVDPTLPAELQAALAERKANRPAPVLSTNGPTFGFTEWEARGSRDGE